MKKQVTCKCGAVYERTGEKLTFWDNDPLHCPRCWSRRVTVLFEPPTRADSGQVRTYPAWRKKFLHSCGLKSVTTRPIRRMRRGMVCSAALRRCALSLLNASSIGLRSGEYFGR